MPAPWCVRLLLQSFDAFVTAGCIGVSVLFFDFFFIISCASVGSVMVLNSLCMPIKARFNVDLQTSALYPIVSSAFVAVGVYWQMFYAAAEDLPWFLVPALWIQAGVEAFL